MFSLRGSSCCLFTAAEINLRRRSRRRRGEDGWHCNAEHQMRGREGGRELLQEEDSFSEGGFQGFPVGLEKIQKKKRRHDVKQTKLIQRDSI